MLPFADKYFYPFNKLKVEYNIAFPKFKHLDAILKIPNKENHFVCYSATQGCLLFLKYDENKKEIIENYRYMLNSYIPDPE